MQLSYLLLLLLAILAELLGLDLFLKGFFPVKKAVSGYATFKDLPREPSGQEAPNMHSEDASHVPPPIEPVFSRLVIVLIDALRADFVYGPRNEDDMPHTRALLASGGTRSFLAKAHPPTVTMPRIKALTSGTIPGFVDLVLNFDSSALAEDNLISQMYRHGRHLYFYGDDTWMRLFPDQFAKADGTTSFYVTDYTEVDNNVTRHVRPSLADPTWDALILHYLGLDHIGHLGGPNSPLVPAKLREMDSVVQTIHQAMKQQDESSSSPGLIVLCGDHGMSDAGSHGGASVSETITPLVFISSAFKKDQNAAVPFPIEAQQIDLAPTLALLLGLPIPQNSLGVAILPLLDDTLSARELLRALQLNAHQLSRVLEKNVDSLESDEGYLAYQHALRLHGAWLEHKANGSSLDASGFARKIAALYSKAMGSMRDKVSSSLARYDLHSMGCGVVIMWQVLALLLFCALGHRGQTPSTPDLEMPVLLLIGCCLATGLIQVAMCTAAGGETSVLLCAASIGAWTRSALVVAMVGCLATVLLSAMQGSSLLFFNWSGGLSWLEIFLLVGTIGHSFSLASSSFVEEEHQTWYFLCTTLTIGLFGRALTTAIGTSGDQRSIGAAIATAIALIVGRLLRAWNQTGIKWADRPDIGDWLVRPENQVTLSVVTFVSFAIIYIVRCFKRPKVRLMIGLLGAYFYRYAVGSVSFPFLLPTSQKGLYEARIVYAIVFFSLGICLINFARWIVNRNHQTQQGNPQVHDQTIHDSSLTSILKELFDVQVLMSALLLRPHNSSVVAMVMLLQHCIVGTVLPWLHLKPWAVALVHVWMGQFAFFAQGNSNSIATVDISAGYVGMGSYIHAVAGLLTALSTYAGPLLCLLRLLLYLAEHYQNRYPSVALEVASTLVLTRALPLAIYSFLVSLQRYHLFVWTVFSPKLLYQTMNTYVSFAVVSLLLMHSGAQRWWLKPKS